MDVGSAVTQGLIGIQRSQNEISRSAQQIAQAGTTDSTRTTASSGDGRSGKASDVTESLVNIKAQTQVFNSSAKVVKAADETIGTLLNVKA